MNLAEYATYDALGLAELVAKKQVIAEGAGADGRAARRSKRRSRGQRRGRDLSRPHRGARREDARQRPVPRRAVPDQGRVRPREGPQDRVRQPAVRGHDGRGDTLSRRAVQGVAASTSSAARRRRNTRCRPRPRARMFGNTSNPWKQGYSAGGSTRRRAGGRHLRHGADRARLRHRRLDPHPGQLVRRRRLEALARARLGRPVVDEGGWGYSRTSCRPRPCATWRRCSTAWRSRSPAIPSSFPSPTRPMRSLRARSAPQAQDRHRARRAGRREGRSRGGRRRGGGRQGAGRPWAMPSSRRAPTWAASRRCRRCTDVFFFGFDSRLDGYAKRSGTKVGPDTLEPVICRVYQ